MQTFLTLPTRSSSHKGFTLVELLISIAIIGIVTSLVLVKYSSFDSTVLLKGAAYEIGVTLREVQIKALSHSRNGTTVESFNYPYGVTFTPLSKTYSVFRYATTSARIPRFVDTSYASYPELIQSFTLDRSMQVEAVCITVSGVEDCTTPTRLDVSFRRPEFTSLFYVTRTGFPDTPQPTVESAKIKVNSTSGGSGVFWIVVNLFGQISVSKAP
ncbi:MAG: type II secretion system protein [Minisyncoccia bacterium]